MKKMIGCCLMCCLPLLATAQMPQHEEPTDTKPHDSEAVWKQKLSAPALLWGSTNTRYAKLSLPTGKMEKSWKTTAWRGERVNGQAVLYTPYDLRDVQLATDGLRNGKYTIPNSAVTLSFVRYVLTDELNKDGKGGCGHRPDKTKWDSSIVADALDPVKMMPIKACTTRPLWIGIQVPHDAQPGTYRGTLTVNSPDLKKPLLLPYEVRVTARTLPKAHDWKFHLDLWQNPYAVARFYHVPLWSKEHFDYMRPSMERLAAAGQKVITASIMQHPWNGQTEDPFKSMVLRTKHIDGTWSYNYTVFDRWVEFMMSTGIDEQINCYTMIPWALKFDYLDEATNSIQYLHATPGDKAYTAYWKNFLVDFAKHLKEKGWFTRTAIAIDERSMPHMREAFKLVKEADPNYRISGQVHYYPEVEPLIDDLCLAYGETLPTEVWNRRRIEGKLTTVYTCCTEAYPNMFSFSAPAEAAWLPWHAMAGGYDGYLRWAYNSWTTNPLTDTRFRTWAAGDCYLVYPGASSIRLEKLIEGIQDAEKIRLLRQEFSQQEESAKLKRLNETVSRFMPENMDGTNATEMVEEGRRVLNSL